MSIFDDLLGGGGGGDPSAGMRQMMIFLQQQQAAQTLETARQKEQAITGTNLRRDELLNRSGYAGDVMVGAAQERTATTLDKQMSQPGADPVQKSVYDKAIAQQAEDTTKSWRIVSGLQYEAEDALTALAAGFDPTGAHGNQGPNIQARLDALKEKYPWLDTSGLEKELGANDTRAAAAAKAKRDNSTVNIWERGLSHGRAG